MKSSLLSLALFLLFTTTRTAPVPEASPQPKTSFRPFPLRSANIILQTEIQERDPLPPVWCVWETNANGRGRHLDCSDPPEGPGIGDPFGPDGTGLGDLDGGYDPVTEGP